MPPRVQLVVPCFNEAGRLTPDAFLQFVANGPDIGFLFVDDGSTDATRGILADLAARGGANIAVLTLNHNVGKARAVQLGVRAAFERQPEFVGFWDADLSTPLTAVPEFMDVFRSDPAVEIVMGARVKLLGRQVTRSLVRHYAGRVFATAASFALGVAVYDTQCGAKIFRATPGVRQVFEAPFRSKWIFDVEILSRYIAATSKAGAGSRIHELPLTVWTAMPGSKLRARHGVRAIWDLALIARESSRRRGRLK
jgi:glycosyltransferase involved in cell wall biosynthesis